MHRIQNFAIQSDPDTCRIRIHAASYMLDPDPNRILITWIHQIVSFAIYQPTFAYHRPALYNNNTFVERHSAVTPEALAEQVS